MIIYVEVKSREQKRREEKGEEKREVERGAGFWRKAGKTVTEQSRTQQNRVEQKRGNSKLLISYCISHGACVRRRENSKIRTKIRFRFFLPLSLLFLFLCPFLSLTFLYLSLLLAFSAIFISLYLPISPSPSISIPLTPVSITNLFLYNRICYDVPRNR